MALTVKNALFIMCDQLRWDYLSCYGHPTLETPNVDRLAARGVRFDRAYVQSPVCGASRMSYYTGRYMTSHGAIWNFVPLAANQVTLGDFLRAAGIPCGVIGKTHVEADLAGMQRLGIDPRSETGILLGEGGFEPVARDDGTWPLAYVDDARSPYSRFLRERGYLADNPWHDFGNSGIDAHGQVLSGWEMRYAKHATRVSPDESETGYVTDRAIAFVQEAGDRPWCLHLSYIKPHWPYMAPAPYNALYGTEDLIPVKQDPRELEHAHPVVAGYRNFAPSLSFARAEVRETVIPTYMGLIREVDDAMGRLFESLRVAGRLDDTLIVFCSDHGDYLGDHYLGEKELFHDTVARTPLIIVDPRPSADATRGSSTSALVEAIDVVPTILDALGIQMPEHLLEGQSLVPLVSGTAAAVREASFSEATYAFRDVVRLPLGRPVDGCHNYMVRSDRWKLNFYDGFRPELFDLIEDPDEFHDLSANSARAGIVSDMQALLFDWVRHRKIHTTVANDAIAGWNAKEAAVGIKIGEW